VAPTIGTDAITDAGAPVPFGVDSQADHADEFATVDNFDAELVLATWHLVGFDDDRVQPGSLLVTSRLVNRQESEELCARGPTPCCLEVVAVDLAKSNPLPFDHGREDARDRALHVSSLLPIDEPRRAGRVGGDRESSQLPRWAPADPLDEALRLHLSL
jgi:hypothetical protein